MQKIIEFAHYLLKEKITSSDICLDMTLGNGNDTLFLLKYAKFVYAFDIQKEALENSYKKLLKYNNYKLILDSHENFDKYVKEPIKSVIFNLGYLPKGNKNITTNCETTLKTLNKALNVISTNGIIIIVVYPGHEEGMKESLKLNDFLKTLDQKKFEVLKYEFFNQINNPPYLFAIEKIVKE